MGLTFWLIAITTVLHGIIAGLSFDVATVKLPTRNRIGVIAYARFARGNDLGNGLVVYPLLGIAAVLSVLGTTIAAYSSHAPSTVLAALVSSCVGAIAHSFGTAKAAPIMLSLKRTPDDEKILTGKLNSFAAWHAFRAIF